MTDMSDLTPAEEPSGLAVCPWCSAPLSAPSVTCPSCGANLTADEVAGPVEVPGVTAVDASAVSLGRPPAIQSRNRLLGWINGTNESDTLTEADAAALAPPDAAVRQEILRLELEALVANQQAEADAALSEAAESGRTIDIPDDLQGLAPESLVAAVDPDVPPPPATEAAPPADDEVPPG
jgi:hypothetical protein